MADGGRAAVWSSLASLSHPHRERCSLFHSSPLCGVERAHQGRAAFTIPLTVTKKRVLSNILNLNRTASLSSEALRDRYGVQIQYAHH